MGYDFGGGADDGPAVIHGIEDLDVFVDVIELVEAAETIDVAVGDCAECGATDRIVGAANLNQTRILPPPTASS